MQLPPIPFLWGPPRPRLPPWWNSRHAWLRPRSSRECEGANPSGGIPTRCRGGTADAPGRDPGSPRGVEVQILSAATRRGVEQFSSSRGSYPRGRRCESCLRYQHFHLGPWCKSSMAGSNPAGPGANPGGPVSPCPAVEALHARISSMVEQQTWSLWVVGSTPACTTSRL